MVMEFIDGEPLSPENPKTPEILGRTQACLHNIDPHPLIKVLRNKGIDDQRYRLGGQLLSLNERINESGLKWLSEAFRWLDLETPSEPEKPSIIHGDLHPMNIMVKEGEVTGILDCPNFQIGEPAMDVGFTLLLIRATSLRIIEQVPMDDFIDRYLEAYRKISDLDERNLEYYIALRAVRALQEGVDGQKIWTQPQIVQNLVKIVKEITDLAIEYPWAVI
jgi:aminoglycoside phosphotransferase (APT) family kinase protein